MKQIFMQGNVGGGVKRRPPENDRDAQAGRYL